MRQSQHGIDSQLYTSKYDHPKPPRVDVFVSYWHGSFGGARAAQAVNAITPLAGPFTMAASYSGIILDCKVTLPGQEKPVFSQHFEKSGFGSGSTEK
ncbi:MAG TPA: hypothetical protein VFK05_01125 [Polyangiaceae bacterium]|nr:hypothetical protein [Polyangiaceae bacterium]